MRFIQLAMACSVGAVVIAPAAAPAVAGHSAKHVIAAVDRDNDGSLDRGEVYRAAIAKFKRLNTDKDRTLEPGELSGVLSGRAFAAANPDKDGSISLGEYLHFTKKLFKATNTDKDHTIEADELNSQFGEVLSSVIK